jgi:hypothetical protein
LFQSKPDNKRREKEAKRNRSDSYKTIALKLTFMCNFPRTILDEKLRALLGHQSKKERFTGSSYLDPTVDNTRPNLVYVVRHVSV